MKKIVKKQLELGRTSLNSVKSPIYKVSRSTLKDTVRLLLMVEAGGRCEFDGCNEYLFEDPLTLRQGNFGEAAHIVAFRPIGPRGHEGIRPKDIHNPDNLMLLCPRHHKLIDSSPGDFSRSALEEYKKQHEKRIRLVTSMGPDRKTDVLIFTSPIRGQQVSIPYSQIIEAVSPGYPTSREGFSIDLAQLADNGASFTRAAAKTISERMKEFFSTAVKRVSRIFRSSQ